jgi:hypothetical protein
MKRIFSLLFFHLLLLSSLSAAEIALNGNYYGNNLVVVNPSLGTGFCVTEVLVNGTKTQDEIRSNSFEIDFSLLGLKTGDAVKVVIRHQSGCVPTIVNPTALSAQVAFSFVFAKFDRAGKFTWNIKGEAGEDPFFVEQFRWNKWVQVAEVRSEDSTRFNTWLTDVNSHLGLNQFRVLKIDPNGNPVYSKVVKFNNIKAVEVTLTSPKVTDKILFSAETMYELFDQKGNYVSGGIALEVDVTEIEKGKYFLNYDTKSVTITKK